MPRFFAAWCSFSASITPDASWTTLTASILVPGSQNTSHLNGNDLLSFPWSPTASARAAAVEIQRDLSEKFPFRCETFWDPGTGMLAVKVVQDTPEIREALERHQASKGRGIAPVGPIYRDEMAYFYVPYY